MPEATKKMPVKYSAKSRKCIKRHFMVVLLSWKSSNKKKLSIIKNLFEFFLQSESNDWPEDFESPLSLQLTSVKNIQFCFEKSRRSKKNNLRWNKTNLVTLLQIQKSRELMKWKFVKSQREFRITIQISNAASYFKIRFWSSWNSSMTWRSSTASDFKKLRLAGTL